VVSEKEFDRALEALRQEEKEKRRQTEKKGGILLAGIGLLMTALFLWVLVISPKTTLNLLMSFAATIMGIAIFAWGLVITIIGRKK
jgi:polyferredoxin